MSEARHDLAIEGYAIVRKIDEGGMGEVFEARQAEPARRVAIKLVKHGMDSDEVLSRFESERQALALMSHAAIARVFAAGTTASGRPYFVMEYVEGVPITDFCDRARLGLEARIALFLEVCEGVQHAHQKGIIHRDIKPSNVLVAHEDGHARPKIIDFGLAKALAGSSLVDSGLTQVGSPIGTPECMSPEQLELEGTHVDTRTDVYALGILLYDLLVGTKPFLGSVIADEGFFEFRRQVLEVDAPQPSSRATDGTASVRGTTTALLARALRGDLDWIVGRALEKLPDHRYPSVSELAADLRRHLADEPVQAGPPSKRYRIQKFVRRNRLAVASAIGLVAAMGLGIAGTSLALVRAVDAEEMASSEATRANQEARTARRTADFMTGLFEVVDPGEARGNSVTAREILDRGASRIDAELREEPEVRASLMGTMGVVYSRLGLYRSAVPLLRGSLDARRRIFGDDDARVAASRNALGVTLGLTAEYEEAERELRAALEARRQDGDEIAVAESLFELGTVMAKRGDNAGAETLLRESLELRRRLLGKHADVAASLDGLAYAIHDQNETEGVEAFLREALALRTELLGTHPATAESMNNLGTFLYGQKRRDEAVPLLEQALAMKRTLYGAVHPDIALGLNNLGFVQHDMGDLAGAEELFREAVEQQRALLGDAHPDLGQALNNLAFVLHDRDDYEGARAALFEAVAVYRRGLGDSHADVLRAVKNAEALVTVALTSRERDFGAGDARTLDARLDMAELYRIAGRPADARPLAEDIWQQLREKPALDEALLARAESLLGSVLADLGKDEGLELLESGLAKLLRLGAPPDARTREVAEQLARLHEPPRRPEDAARVRASVASPDGSSER